VEGVPAAPAERENIEVASPTIRAARRVGSLSDDDAQAAMRIGQDRNLAVHMYRQQLGIEIEQRLAGHSAVLRGWLDVLKEQAIGDT
jgi:hypothetical protein